MRAIAPGAKPQGDSPWCGNAGGYAQNVIPAKGEARVSGLAQRGAEGMDVIVAEQWNEKADGRNALAPRQSFSHADKWTPAQGRGDSL